MRNLLTAILLIVAATTCYGQNVGIRVNYVISNWEGLIYASSDMETATINNFSIGIYGHAPFNPSIVFEPGIFITPKGTKMMKEPSLPFDPATNKSLYLDVPLILKMYIGGGGFHVNAGPQVSYLLSNKIVSESGEEFDTIDQLNKWDFAVIFGLAYDFRFGMNIGASFDLGLSNMLINDYYEWTETKNRVIRVSLGYTFL